MMNAADLMNGLAQMTGTETYHRHPLMRSLMLTDGVVFLAENAEAWWLTDIVASHQVDAKVRAEDFQLWELVVAYNKGVVTMRSDSDVPPIVTQEIEFTDFPLDSVKFYLTGKVLMLPSEY